MRISRRTVYRSIALGLLALVIVIYVRGVGRPEIDTGVITTNEEMSSIDVARSVCWEVTYD